MTRRPLILKCSARKRGGAEPIPAIERYDGPLWQVLRSFVRAQPLFAADLDVYALSAAFGLIPANQLPRLLTTLSCQHFVQLKT